MIEDQVLMEWVQRAPAGVAYRPDAGPSITGRATHVTWFLEDGMICEPHEEIHAEVIREGRALQMSARVPRWVAEKIKETRATGRDRYCEVNLSPGP